MMTHATRELLEAISANDPTWHPTDGGGQMWILECLGTFADLIPGPVMVKANLGVLLGPSHTHPGPEEVDTNCELLCSSNFQDQRQHLILGNTGVPP